MLYLDVQILTALRAKELAAAIVRTNVRSINFLSSSPEVLLPLILVLLVVNDAVRCIGPVAGDLLIGSGGLTVLLDIGLNLSSLLLLQQLSSELSFASFLQQFLLVLLLAKSMQELVGLSQDLWYQSILVEVLYVENFSQHF